MIQGETGIVILCTEQSVYVRVKGRGEFQNSRSLRGFAADMIQRGSRQFVFDLEQCGGLDSTFLGVLTGIGLALRQQNPPGTSMLLMPASRAATCFSHFGWIGCSTYHPRLPGSESTHHRRAIHFRNCRTRTYGRGRKRCRPERLVNWC